MDPTNQKSLKHFKNMRKLTNTFLKNQLVKDDTQKRKKIIFRDKQKWM